MSVDLLLSAYEMEYLKDLSMNYETVEIIKPGIYQNMNAYLGYACKSVKTTTISFCFSS